MAALIASGDIERDIRHPYEVGFGPFRGRNFYSLSMEFLGSDGRERSCPLQPSTSSFKLGEENAAE